MNKFRIATLWMLAAIGVAYAQIEPVELQIVKTVEVPRVAGGTLSFPVKSDDEGNIYFRLISRSNPDSGPVVRISPDGQRVVAITTSALPTKGPGEFLDFGTGRGGEFFILAGAQEPNQPPAYYLFRFDRDGKLTSSTTLDARFEPRQFAAFSTGDFLVSGEAKDAGDSRPKLVTALFDSRGRFVKYVRLKTDIEAPDASTKKDAEQKTRDYEASGNLSAAQLGDDGNIYLNRPTPQGQVFVISPAGEVVRRFHFKAPPKTELGAIRLSRGQLVAEFMQYDSRTQQEVFEIKKYIYCVYDSHTGQEIRRYSLAGDRVRPAFAAYQPGILYFLALAGPGKYQIEQAEGR